MFVSDAKREANRRNAARSTGPRTAEGKAISRQNAVKHGLCASVVVPEDAKAVEERFNELFWDLKPRTQLQNYCIGEMVIITLRIDRVKRIERRLRDRSALRAMTSWDEDRGLDAERVGSGLAGRPAEVVAELRRTPKGCDWLINRWAMLARAADLDVGWDAGRTALAFDLLGTPAEFRFGHPGASVDEDGREVDDGSDRAGVARAQIARLRQAREAAADLDEVDRSLAESDLVHEPDPEIRRLRRYEASLHHRLRWFLARFRDPVDKHRIGEHLLPRRELHPDGSQKIVPVGSFYRDDPEAEAPAVEAAEPEVVVPEELPSEDQNEPKAGRRNEPKSGPKSWPGILATPDASAIAREDGPDREPSPRRGSKRRELDPARA